MLSDNRTQLETLFIADVHGAVVMDGSKGKDLGNNIADRAYFKDAMKGLTAWSDIVTSKGSGKLVQVFAYPIKDKTGNVVGVLTAVIKLDPISDKVLALKEGMNGYAYLADQNGVILAHPKSDYIGKNLKDFGIPELTAEIPNMTSGKSGEIKYTYNGVTKLNIYKPLGKLSVSLNADQKEYLKPVAEMGMSILLFGAIFMIIGGIFSYIMAKVIALKIGRMQQVLKQAEEGDLTVRVVGKTLNDGDEIDQMGLSVNHMMASFNRVIGDIIDATEVMSSTSQEMAASSEEGGRAATEVTASIQQISAGLQDQAEYVMKTNDTVQAMQVLIQDTVAETHHMAEEAKKVLDTAKDSQGYMLNTMSQMSEIQTSSLTTYEIIKTLSSESERIGQISLAISAIADQTNLLALNAAIEAARAGEQGRGFAVVAEEIRKLASESMASADDIGKLIQSIQSEIDHAEKAINNESESITKGVAVIEDTQGAFSHIIEAVEKTTNIMSTVLDRIDRTKVSTYEVTN
jgi:methyl-accepting chemotaxis protein